MTKYKHTLLNILPLFLICVTIFGCRKIDTRDHTNVIPVIKRDFFKISTNVDPLVIRLNDEIKRRNNIKEFVNEFAELHGFPVWEKALRLNSNVKSLRDGVVQSTDTIIFLPLVIQGESSVSGFIKAIFSDSIYLSYSLDEFYKNYSFSDSTATVLAEEFAEGIMYLNSTVFGKEKYTILDRRLFNTASLDSLEVERIVKIVPDFNRVASICYSTTVYTISANWHCTGCTTNTCDACPACVDYTVTSHIEFNCYNQDIGGNGGSTGGGGGGGGGGVAIPPYYPCTGTSTLVPGTNPIPPCPPPSNTPGWEENIAKPCDNYIQVLEQDVNFATRFKELGSYSNLSNNFEKGYLVQNRAANNYVAKDGFLHTDLGGGIQWENPIDISGTTHNHYIGLGEMFSPQDVISLANSVIRNEGNDPANLFIGVYTRTGPYLLKITDLAKFTIFANKIAGSIAKESKFRNGYKDNFRYSENATAKDLNEMGFLRMMNDFGAGNGLGFYRGNEDCNQWTSLKLERHATGPDTIEPTDCE